MKRIISLLACLILLFSCAAAERIVSLPNSRYVIDLPDWMAYSPPEPEDYGVEAYISDTLEMDFVSYLKADAVKQGMAETLRETAEAGGGAYVHAGNEEFGLNPIIADIRKMEAEEFSSVVFEEYDEQYMYFFAAALALFVLELLIGERRAKRRLFE